MQASFSEAYGAELLSLPQALNLICPVHHRQTKAMGKACNGTHRSRTKLAGR